MDVFSNRERIIIKIVPTLLISFYTHNRKELIPLKEVLERSKEKKLILKIGWKGPSYKKVPEWFVDEKLINAVESVLEEHLKTDELYRNHIKNRIIDLYLRKNPEEGFSTLEEGAKHKNNMILNINGTEVKVKNSGKLLYELHVKDGKQIPNEIVDQCVLDGYGTLNVDKDSYETARYMLKGKADSYKISSRKMVLPF